jgi:hypothetical protein
MPQFGASLMILIYDRKTFKVQATDPFIANIKIVYKGQAFK